MTEKNIRITASDRQRLIDLIMDAQSGEYRGSIYLDKLRGELERAQIVLPQEIPAQVITMNSKVALLDLDTKEEEIYTLVYPENANTAEGRISILAPVGTAMLGYSVGDTFEWEVPAGKRRLKVDRILYQPESAGDYEL
jgi:regulator of nucleoside diphosphate kinase